MREMGDERGREKREEREEKEKEGERLSSHGKELAAGGGELDKKTTTKKKEKKKSGIKINGELCLCNLFPSFSPFPFLSPSPSPCAGIQSYHW